VYAQQKTWLPSSQSMGLGAISFEQLQRAARRSRGIGQAIVSPPSSGIAPGSPCYDPSHDNGENHCASFTSVVASAFGMGPNQTTTCSQAEQACFEGGAIPLPNLPGILTPAQQNVNAVAQPDICSQTFGISCTTLGIFAALALIAIPLLTAGRRF
jgi:hypothetical protein